jgi:outer membrane protein assembly factor BamB
MTARRIASLCVLVLAAACSKEKDVEPPAELVEFPATLDVQRAWSAGVDGSDSPLRLGLGLAVTDGRVFAAGRSGDVAAFALDNGRVIWRARTRARLAGGTGAGFDLVVVGSSDGEVIALAANDGKERWRVRIGGEVLAAPAVAQNAVVVRTVAGRLYGLAPGDGRELWVHEQSVPRLSLRGTSRPVIAGEVALCGFDNGRVVAVNLADGATAWETAVAPARGRTELERLVDIDSAVHVVGPDVYAVGFQGRAAMLALDSGQIWWSRELSSHRGLDVDDDALYVSTSGGELVSMRRRTGAELWRQDLLARRGLSAPAVIGDAVAVADFQGFVHWFDRATGAPAARASAGSARVTNPPIVSGDLLLVINDEGRITAFRTQPRAGARAQPPAEPAPATSDAPTPADEPQPAPPPETPPDDAEATPPKD